MSPPAYRLFRLFSLFFLLLGRSFSVMAQTQCLTLCDSATRRPVPYATVYLAKARTGTYADEGGRVCLDNGADSITVSSVGYVTAHLFWRKNSRHDTLFLARKTTLLREIVVTSQAKKSRRTQLGYRNKSLFSENSYNPNGGYRLATFVDAEDHESAKIRQLVCELSSHKKSVIEAYTVRLRVYANDPITQLPGADLLPENVVLTVPNSAKKMVANLTKYAVDVPKNGFWIGVESVGYWVAGTYYPIDDRRYGKNALKSDDRKTGTLSPAYLFIKSEPNRGAIARWNGNWTHERYMPDLAFCFSAIIDE